MKTTAEILHTVSIWIIVLPFLVGFINFKALNRDSRWIFFLVCIALVPQMFTAILVNETPLLNLSYNVYTPIELGVLYLLFISKYNRPVTRSVVKATAVLYALACLYFFVSFGVTQKFLSSLVCINNVCYMLWILLLLKQEYSVPETIIQKNNPFTWYLIAIILYAPCTVAHFALYYYIRDVANPLLIGLSAIQSIFNILLYLFFSVGLFIRKQVKSFVY